MDLCLPGNSIFFIRYDGIEFPTIRLFTREFSKKLFYSWQTNILKKLIQHNYCTLQDHKPFILRCSFPKNIFSSRYLTWWNINQHKRRKYSVSGCLRVCAKKTKIINTRGDVLTLWPSVLFVIRQLKTTFSEVEICKLNTDISLMLPSINE